MDGVANQTQLSSTNSGAGSTLVIACGAIAHELVALKNANQWHHMDIHCLPAQWHNTPQHITPAVASKIEQLKDRYQRIFVGYADCGTGGSLDKLLDEYRIERLPGAHCYSFFAGQQVFDAMAEAQPGTFYLTDYLLEHFERLILEELGINRHPQLRNEYFGNYTRLMYLRQQRPSNPEIDRVAKAQAAAQALGLPLTIHDTGLEPLANALMPITVKVSGKQQACPPVLSNPL